MLQATEDKRKEKRRQKVCVYYVRFMSCFICFFHNHVLHLGYQKYYNFGTKFCTKINVVHVTNTVKINLSTRAGIMLSTSYNLPLIPWHIQDPGKSSFSDSFPL